MFISDKILKEGKSPKQIEEELQQLENAELGTVGVQTIYSAIKKGYIPGVTMETLRSSIVTLQKEGNICIPKWFINKYGLVSGQKFEISLCERAIILKNMEKETLP